MSIPSRTWIGVVAWAAFVFARARDLQAESWTQALLLFAALVLVPLALELFNESEEDEPSARWLGWVGRLQLPAALLLLVSCWLSPGWIALSLAIPWAALTCLLALVGVRRLRLAGWRRELDGVARDTALIFAVVGGAWTLADRGGFAPLGFDRAIVALTAVHFHYAGILLPLFAGLLQRELFFWRLASRAVVGVVLGVPAVALGIVARQLGWGNSFEAAAGCGLALAGMAVGILHVRLAVDSKQPLATRALLAIAGVSIFVSMMLAAAYALRGVSAAMPALGIPQMRMLHGTINALGFGLCGVLAWRRLGGERVAPAT
jgi:hypothetical protein